MSFVKTLSVALLVGALTAAPTWAEPPLLGKLIDEGISRNPQIQAAHDRWQMTRHQVIPASSLEDPMLTVALTNFPIDSFRDDQTPMTGKDLKISQKFPFPGKLGTRAEVAQQQALWFKGVYLDAKGQLAGRIKDRYYQLYYLERALKVTEKNLEVLDNLIRLTETRYKVGKGLQQDVLRAQTEQSRMLDQMLLLTQQRQTAQAKLYALLGSDSQLPALNTLPEFDLPSIMPDTAALQQGSEVTRPLFAAYRSLADRYKAQRKLAQLDFKPDFNVYAGYRQREAAGADDGTDFFSAGVTVNLPVFREKRREKVAEADSGIRLALAQYEQFRNEVYRDIRDAAAQFEKNHRQEQLYRTGLIPQAEQTFQASLSAYSVGKVDFLSLLDAQLKVYRTQLEHYRAKADVMRSLAKLEAATGTNL